MPPTAEPFDWTTATTPAQAQPLLKWVGGKSQLLPKILEHVPLDFRRYHEPFLGGGALFFWLASALRPGRGVVRRDWAVLSDANKLLIDTYETVMRAPGPVLKALQGHARHHKLYGNDHYYRVRKAINRKVEHDPVGAAAAFIYLNRTCWNGVWRVNKAGAFNVPPGAYKNPTIDDGDRIHRVADLLEYVTLLSGRWQHALAGGAPERGDVVYFDPPYLPISATANFAGYTSDGFDLTAHELLATSAHQLAERGVTVILSNSDTPLARKLYKGPRLKILSVKAGRSISCKGDKRDAVGELLVVSR